MKHHKIKLIISSANGDWERKFSKNQKVHSVKMKAMAQFNMDQSQADQFILTYEGVTLDETKSLCELSIPNKAVLILERRDVTKI